MPTNEEVRRAVADRMRRNPGITRAYAQRLAAHDLGVPLSEVQNVALFSGDTFSVDPNNAYGYDGNGGDAA